jgi:hypothetical protein
MRRWNRYEATKYAFFDFIGRKPAPTGAGGGIVKRGEIVLKDEMGYVDKFIGWIGRHKKLTAAGIIGLFGLGLYATNDTVKDKTDKAVGAALFGGAPAVIDNLAANVTAAATPQVKQPRNDIKVIFGTTDDKYVTPQMIRVATYLNESQKVPNENIRILNSSEFTYENFLKTVKEVGMNASDSDTLIINPSSDAGKDVFTFSKEGVKYNKTDGRTMDYRPYKMIAEAIKNNTNPKSKKVIIINGCYSGSAIPILEETGIRNSAVITSTTATALAPASSELDTLLLGSFAPQHIDYNKDGKISVKELFQLEKETSQKNWEEYKPQGKVLPQEEWVIPQMWDPDNITDELVLVDK